MIVWTHAVSGVLFACVLYCICTCSRQLNMERCSRNMLIVIVIGRYSWQSWGCLWFVWGIFLFWQQFGTEMCVVQKTAVQWPKSSYRWFDCIRNSAHPRQVSGQGWLVSTDCSGVCVCVCCYVLMRILESLSACADWKTEQVVTLVLFQNLIIMIFGKICGHSCSHCNLSWMSFTTIEMLWFYLIIQRSESRCFAGWVTVHEDKIQVLWSRILCRSNK